VARMPEPAPAKEDLMKRSKSEVTPRLGRQSSYPEPFRRRVAGRTRWGLGDAFSLTQFGAGLVELEPGAVSSIRHWHTHEDELVYMLEGEAVLVTDAGEETLRPGDFVGFPAGVPIGHHIVNRSDRKVAYLEIGTRNPVADVVYYPDDDLVARSDGTSQRCFFRRTGEPY